MGRVRVASAIHSVDLGVCKEDPLQAKAPAMTNGRPVEGSRLFAVFATVHFLYVLAINWAKANALFACIGRWNEASIGKVVSRQGAALGVAGKLHQPIWGHLNERNRAARRRDGDAGLSYFGDVACVNIVLQGHLGWLLVNHQVVVLVPSREGDQLAKGASFELLEDWVFVQFGILDLQGFRQHLIEMEVRRG